MRTLLLLVSMLLMAVPSSTAPAADSAKPNFILINIDDLGYGDIGPYGSHKNQTPHLDRMAAEGRKLTSHYAAPVCSPSRAALMTGCYPKRVLPIRSVLFPAAAVGLNPKEVTIAELLQEADYATGCIGKWHLGDQPAFLPTRQGFDYYFGIPYSNDMGTAEEGSKSDPGQPIPKPKQGAKRRPPDETGVKGFSQPPLPLLENEKVVERVNAQGQHSITQRYTEKAQQFLRDHKDRSFFLYLPHTAVHFPLYPGKQFLGSGRSKQELHGNWVEEVDWSVGEVLETVRELGLGEKTLVIFTSDNGGAIHHGSSNKPLRGAKGSTWEGGIRVPTIAWWPGRIPAGTVTAEVTSMMDILPTFVKLAGGKTPSDSRIDGYDISPLLLDSTNAGSPRDVFYYYRGLNLEAVRSGPWKLHLKSGELYHLIDDLEESSNLADQQPEQVARLRALAAEMEQDLGLKEVGSGCRPLGRDPNPLPLIAHDGTVRSGFEP